MIKPPVQIFGMEGRYACALYSAATKMKTLDQVEKDLIKFQAVIKKDEKLRDILSNPTIQRKVMMSAIKHVGETSNMTPASTNLLVTLAENGRLKRTDAVITAFRTIMAAHRGEVVCEVITAKPLESGQQTKLESALKAFLKPSETLQITSKVDPSIIGGMIVSIGDKYVDMSISTKVKKYKELIEVPA